MDTDKKSLICKVYDDIISPPAQVLGNALVKLATAYILEPASQRAEMRSERYRQKLEEAKKKINEKINSIPEENIIEPDISITGPTLENMKYFVEEDDYVEMFTNLLKKACDKREQKIHPSFSSIITQLSHADAKLLKIISDNHTIPIIELEERHSDGCLTPYYGYYTKEYSYDDLDTRIYSPYEMMISIENLRRLQLVLLNSHIISTKEQYEDVRKTQYYKSITSGPNHLSERRYRVELTRLGARFVSVCLP